MTSKSRSSFNLSKILGTLDFLQFQPHTFLFSIAKEVVAAPPPALLFFLLLTGSLLPADATPGALGAASAEDLGLTLQPERDWGWVAGLSSQGAGLHRLTIICWQAGLLLSARGW